MDWNKRVEKMIKKGQQQVVGIDIDGCKISYSNMIKLHRDIETLSGDKEMVRGFAC